MDKAEFSRYIEEMRRMRSEATIKPVVAQAPQKKTESHPNAPDMTGAGRLIVNVTSVRGIYPVGGAVVKVFTGDEEEMELFFEGVTDRSGKTSTISLPAPAGEFSETPNPPERPYAFYNIKVSADGFSDSYSYNVAVFDGVTSLQNVGLSPIASETPQNRPIVIDEYENYNL